MIQRHKRLMKYNVLHRTYSHHNKLRIMQLKVRQVNFHCKD